MSPYQRCRGCAPNVVHPKNFAKLLPIQLTCPRLFSCSCLERSTQRCNPETPGLSRFASMPLRAGKERMHSRRASRLAISACCLAGLVLLQGASVPLGTCTFTTLDLLDVGRPSRRLLVGTLAASTVQTLLGCCSGT